MPCTETIWYEDADGDGLGNPDVSQSACEQPDGYVADNTDTNDTGNASSAASTPVSAFDDFNSDAVMVSFDGNEITIESNGMPHHTSPYWGNGNSLYIDPVIANASQMSPGTINERSYTLTVPAAPQKASSTSATGLGAIGISITGAPIFNDEEGPNVQLSANVASGFDYAGGHMGPTGYHYHLESSDVAVNTLLSHDDEQLVGILQDGFLLYGRKCNSTEDYPTDLDASGGHTHATQHSDTEEFYHYHIINEFYVGSYIILFGGNLQGTPNSIM
ncbi:MAG: YHYH protein [Bacteroidota bacterium]